MLEARTEEHHGIAVLCLAGELDMPLKGELAEALNEAAASQTRLVVDLDRVTFIDSSALGLLIDLDARLTSRDGMLALSSMQPQVRRVFEISGLFRLLRVFEDADRAALYLRQSAEAQ
jgi:anti-anti-sigma factor